MPYPAKPYVATHTATYKSGFKQDLVPYGEPCSHKIGDETSHRPQYCNDTETYLDGGAARCKLDLVPLCAHGYEMCSSTQCESFPKGPPKVQKLPEVRRAIGAYSSRMQI
jgi:hypothetical protein